MSSMVSRLNLPPRMLDPLGTTAASTTDFIDYDEAWFDELLERHRFSMRFKEAGVERSFESAVASRGMQAGLPFTLFVLVASSLFYIADFFFLEGDEFFNVTMVRLPLTAGIIGVALHLRYYPRSFKRYYELIVASFIVVAMASVSMVTALQEGPLELPWGIVLFTPLSLIVVKPRYVYAAVDCYASTVLFMICNFWFHAWTRVVLFGVTTFILFAVFLSLMWNLEELARREFLLSKHYASKKAQTEAMLEKMLPSAVLEDAKLGKRILQSGEATVVFVSICNFRERIANMSPTEAFKLLNTLFGALDDLASRFGIQKIETAMDTFVAVAGLPEPVPDHCRRVATFAVESQNIMNIMFAGQGIHVRVGVHTGVAVAGVIGIKRMFYRLVGDVINTTARICAKAREGDVLIGPEVKALLDKEPNSPWSIIPKGRVMIKGKGMIALYYLSTRDGFVSSPALESLPLSPLASRPSGEMVERPASAPAGPRLSVLRRASLMLFGASRQSVASKSTRDRSTSQGQRNTARHREAQERIRLLGILTGKFSVHKRWLTFDDRVLEIEFLSRNNERLWPVLTKVGAGAALSTLVYAISAPLINDPAETTTFVALGIRVAMLGVLVAARYLLDAYTEFLVPITTYVSLLLPVLSLVSSVIMGEEGFPMFFFYVTLVVYGSQLPPRQTLVVIGINWIVMGVVSALVPAIQVGVAQFGFAMLIVLLCGMYAAGHAERARRRDFALGERILAEQEQFERMVSDLLPRQIVAQIKEEERLRNEARRRVVQDMPKAAELAPVGAPDGTELVSMNSTDQSSMGSFDALLGVRNRNMPAVARVYENTIVLQLDLVGFTALSSRCSPADMHKYLDALFTEFDHILEDEDRGLFKLDTVGDSYQLCAGLFDDVDETLLLQRVLEAGASFRQVVAAMSTPAPEYSSVRHNRTALLRASVEVEAAPPLKCRVGIARGSVIAGVLGKTIPKFNCWGPAMDDANALEQHSPPNGIHVAGDLAEMALGTFSFAPSTVQVSQIGTDKPPYLLVDLTGLRTARTARTDRSLGTSRTLRTTRRKRPSRRGMSASASTEMGASVGFGASSATIPEHSPSPSPAHMSAHYRLPKVQEPPGDIASAHMSARSLELVPLEDIRSISRQSSTDSRRESSKGLTDSRRESSKGLTDSRRASSKAPTDSRLASSRQSFNDDDLGLENSRRSSSRQSRPAADLSIRTVGTIVEEGSEAR